MALVQSPPARALSVPSLIAGVIAFAADLLYLVLVRSQGNPYEARVAFVAIFIASEATVALVAAVVRHPVTRSSLLAAASAGLIVLGVLALFSIGLPLVVAGLLTTMAWTRTTRSSASSSAKPLSLAAAVLAVGVLAGGIGLI